MSQQDGSLPVAGAILGVNFEPTDSSSVSLSGRAAKRSFLAFTCEKDTGI